MAEVTAQLVKELRERTQAGMSDCKGALVEADGDMEKAVEIILKKGLAKSAKRAGAVASEGEVVANVAADGKSGVLVEVNIQTDFAARNEKFRAFAAGVATAAAGAADGANLDEVAFPGAGGKTVAQVRDELIGTIGEKIAVRRWARASVGAKSGRVVSYVHLGGKIGVLVEAETATDAIAQSAAVTKLVDDVAMQVAAMAPQYLARTEVPADAVAKQKEIFLAQLKDEGKPEAAWPKISEGKLNKWFGEICLVEQESVVVPGQKIDQLRAAVEKEAGGTVKLVRFVRFERGEGIEKKQDDFAAEVAKMASQ